MSLIELIQLCSVLLGAGIPWKICRERLADLEVSEEIQTAIRKTLDNGGNLLNGDGTRFVWGEHRCGHYSISPAHGYSSYCGECGETLE